MIAQTSIESYHALSDVRLGALQREVLEVIRECPSLSNRDIADYLGRDICTITGRTNELKEAGLIRCWSTKIDPKTHRKVGMWEAVM